MMRVTVLYYNEGHLSLGYKSFEDLPQGPGGRVVIPSSFRQGKTIVAVLEGAVNVLSRLGDRAFATQS